MTSRYLRFKAEHVTTTPSWALVADDPEGDRRAAAASRSAISQSQRSMSVRGISCAIFCLFVSEWYYGWKRGQPPAEHGTPTATGLATATYIIAFDIWNRKLLSQKLGHRGFTTPCRTGDDPHVTLRGRFRSPVDLLDGVCSSKVHRRRRKGSKRKSMPLIKGEHGGKKFKLVCLQGKNLG